MATILHLALFSAKQGWLISLQNSQTAVRSNEAALLCLICNSMSQPVAWPHAGLTPEGEAIPDMADPGCGTEEAPFQAVLVFSDPIDWYRDLQLITDVIMSGWHSMSCCLSHPQGLVRGVGMCTISIVVAW